MSSSLRSACNAVGPSFIIGLVLKLKLLKSKPFLPTALKVTSDITLMQHRLRLLFAKFPLLL